jgi:hypothetical protein
MYIGMHTYSALVIYNSSTDIRPKETIDISTCHIHVIDGEVNRHTSLCTYILITKVHNVLNCYS